MIYFAGGSISVGASNPDGRPTNGSIDPASDKKRDLHQGTHTCKCAWISVGAPKPDANGRILLPVLDTYAGVGRAGGAPKNLG